MKEKKDKIPMWEEIYRENYNERVKLENKLTEKTLELDKLKQQLAEKDKAIENLRKEFSLRLRLIRHPICEEIRRFIRQPENSIFYDVSLYVETAGLEKLLDKLEKGE